MFAIVEIAGLQYKIGQDQRLFVNRLDAKVGDKVSFDKVLLTSNGSITLGAPTIKGVVVEATVLDHLKADKVIVFKKKRRKGYVVKNGHRQSLTQIQITSISGFEASAKPAKKEKTAPKSSKGDDLTLVEGIGPKVAELFVNSGIVSFDDLSKKSAEELKAILEPKGGVYAAMDPTTWPKQAELAATGKLDELKVWQAELNGGK